MQARTIQWDDEFGTLPVDEAYEKRMAEIDASITANQVWPASDGGNSQQPIKLRRIPTAADWDEYLR